MPTMKRRELILAAMTSSALLLAGCATRPREPEIDFVEVVRRLLLLAAQRALAALMRDGGYYDVAVRRIRLPRSLGGDALDRNLMAMLLSAAFRNELERLANRAAERGAGLVAPVVADTIRTLPVLDAMALVRGEPGAATGFFRERLGPELGRRMLPEIDKGLRLFETPVVRDYLSRVSAVDFAALCADIAGKAANVIYDTMASEEAAIRMDPAGSGDPLLMRVFGNGGGRL